MASLILQRTFKYILTVFATLVLTVGIPSCIGDCPDLSSYFDIQSISSENHNANSNSWVSEIPEGDSVNFEDYYIACIYDYNQYTLASPSYNPFAINSAYARSCARPDNGSPEGLDTILVVTNFDYDNTYLAGDTLTPYVRTRVGNERNSFVSLEEMINLNKSSIKSRNGFHLRFSNAPLFNRAAFTIIMKLGNGEVHTTTTPTIYFK
jgi:hypothetical protein